MARLSLKDLSIARGEQLLIHHFNYHFKSGDIVALVGRNGAGKSTLLKTLSGLLPPKEGQILIDDADIQTLSPRSRASLISFLLQQSPEQAYCTGLGRIAHGLMPIYGYDFFPDGLTMDLIKNVALGLNIMKLLPRRLGQMSGGEQRLVHIAKCLVNKQTKILLLDEPSVFLDFTQQANLITTLQEEAKEGRLVIFASHDAEFIKKCATDVIHIDNSAIDLFKEMGLGC